MLLPPALQQQSPDRRARTERRPAILAIVRPTPRVLSVRHERRVLQPFALGGHDGDPARSVHGQPSPGGSGFHGPRLLHLLHRPAIASDRRPWPAPLQFRELHGLTAADKEAASLVGATARPSWPARSTRRSPGTRPSRVMVLLSQKRRR